MSELTWMELQLTIANILKLIESSYWRMDDCVRGLAWPPGSKADHDRAIAKGDAGREDLKKAYAEPDQLQRGLLPGRGKVRRTACED